MDSLTHLVAGALTPLAFSRAPKRAALVGLGVIAGELPDYDIFFNSGTETFLTLHRGITHAIAWQPVLALCLALPFALLFARPVFYSTAARRTALSGAGLQLPTAPAEKSGVCWGLLTVYTAVFVALLLHLYLDCMTTFGTQILLPISDARINFPGMFIVDVLLTGPALLLLILAWRDAPVLVPYDSRQSGETTCRALLSRKSTRLARAGVLWLICYPLVSWGIGQGAGKIVELVHEDKGVSDYAVLTEPFSPFRWKFVLCTAEGYCMSSASLFSLGEDIVWEKEKMADHALYAELCKQERIFLYFGQFCPLMAQAEQAGPKVVLSGVQIPTIEYAFYDLRYVTADESPARYVGKTSTNFVLQARVTVDGTLLAYRFLHNDNEEDVPWIDTLQAPDSEMMANTQRFRM